MKRRKLQELNLLDDFLFETMVGHKRFGKRFVRILLEKNPKVRVVINAIALETVAEAAALWKEFPVENVSVSQVMAARGRQLGGYELMTGMNPVYVISFSGKGGQ